MKRSRITRSLAAAALCAALAACGKDTPTGTSTPSILRATSARSAALTIGAQQTIALRVENDAGRGVAGQTVTFTADNGGALSSTTAVSGSDGGASTTLTITNVDDPTTVTAKVAGVTQPLTFKFTGKCSTPAATVIDNFCGLTAPTFTGFNGVGVGVAGGALQLSGTGVGGPNQFPGAVKAIGSVDFSNTQKITVRMRNRASSSGTAYIQIALNDVNGVGANLFGNVAGGLVQAVPNDDAWHTYTYDFTGKWVQYDNRPVDRTHIKEVVLLVNPNTSPAFTGTVDVDDIQRVP